MAALTRHPFARPQCGVASVGIAVLILLILAAALATALSMSGSAVRDAAMSEEQIAALFLAESGTQRAQVIISSAAKGGSYTDSTCTNLALVPPTTYTLERGSFSYASAESDLIPCGGINPACSFCTIKVVGTIGSSSRTILTQLSTTLTQGVEGHGSSFTLDLQTTQDHAGAFTNLAYRAKDTSGGSNAQVGTCSNTGGSCVINSDGWNLQRTGTNNVSGMGVYASVPTAGNYSITDTLVDTGGSNPAERNYVQTGALFYPTSGGALSFVGSYGSDTGSNKTTGTSSTSSSLPSGWNCGATNNNANASVAAGADTLVYGFSSWPASAANQLNGVTLGIQPLRQILTMTGTQGDNLYSQIWYAYNPAYFSPTGATNGANFTGSIGATALTGRITDAAGTASGTILTVTSITPSIALNIGDTILIAGVSKGKISTLGTVMANGTGTYNLDTSSFISVPTSMTATSNVLNVSAITAPTYAVLTAGSIGTGDTINVTGTPTVLLQTFGTTGGQGKYTVSGSALTVASASMESSGTTITLFGATTAPSSVQPPAVAVSSGTGQFDSATVTGFISGMTLTVTSCSNGTPSVGDALFGKNIQPNTRIAGSLSGGTACNGTYPITPSQTAAAGTIVARAAVASVSLTDPNNSYTVSRKPTTRLSGSAQLCGGVCAFFFDNSGSNTTFNLNNITSGDDWASGFACLSGANPTKIQILGTIVSKLTSWSEVVY